MKDQEDGAAADNLWFQYVNAMAATRDDLATSTVAISVNGLPARIRWAAINTGASALVFITGLQAYLDWGQVTAMYLLNIADNVNMGVNRWEHSMHADVLAFVRDHTTGPVYVVGHSFGGCVASFLAERLKVDLPARDFHAITFGAPKFAEQYWWDHVRCTHLHVQNTDDAVTYFPPSPTFLFNMVARRFPLLRYTLGVDPYPPNQGVIWHMDSAGNVAVDPDGHAPASGEAAVPQEMLASTQAFPWGLSGHGSDEYQRRLRRRYGFVGESTQIDFRTNFQNAGDGLNWSVAIPAGSSPPPPLQVPVIVGLDAPPLPLLQAIERQASQPSAPARIDWLVPLGPYPPPGQAAPPGPPLIPTPGIPTGTMPRPANAAQVAAAAVCCPIQTNRGLVRVP